LYYAAVATTPLPLPTDDYLGADATHVCVCICTHRKFHLHKTPHNLPYLSTFLPARKSGDNASRPAYPQSLNRMRDLSIIYDRLNRQRRESENLRRKNNIKTYVCVERSETKKEKKTKNVRHLHGNGPIPQNKDKLQSQGQRGRYWHA
jgi:hypothetical protein